jgi:TetR/AcrR family transcriptional regulator, regulator of autoinduction and epiphytic fitness
MTSLGTGAPAGKRGTILDAALKLFGQYGYRRTSIDDIARAAEISKGSVYLSFASKEDLFRALCADLIERVESSVARARAAEVSFEDRLLGILEAKFGLYYETVQRSPHAAELIDSKSRLSADLFAQADRRYLSTVRAAIDAAAARGEIHPARAGLRSREMAELVIGACRGIEVTAPEPATYHRRLKALVHLIVAGLEPNDPDARLRRAHRHDHREMITKTG